MVLALLGGHRFIHDLTSSKMLWWKICVPDPNPKKIWLALSIHIWKMWCWNNMKQVMCPQLLLDHKDLGIWNSSAQFVNWHPGIPQIPSLQRLWWEELLSDLSATSLPINPWPKVDSFHVLVDPSKIFIEVHAQYAPTRPKIAAVNSPPAMMATMTPGKGPVNCLSAKVFWKGLYARFKCKCTPYVCMPFWRDAKEVKLHCNWLIKQNQSNSCWKNGPANTPKSCALILKTCTQNIGHYV